MQLRSLLCGVVLFGMAGQACAADLGDSNAAFAVAVAALKGQNMAVDRGHLAYLNLVEKLNCTYWTFCHFRNCAAMSTPPDAMNKEL